MEGSLEALDVLDSRQFEIVVRRLADSLSYGTDRSPFLGPGLEYVQSRPYAAGDSIRAIDWRVTARTGRFHVKEFESPKRLPVYLLVDPSASMTVHSTDRSKYATALHLAGGLALACLDRVSPVAIVGVGSARDQTVPTLSKVQVMKRLFALQRFRYDEPTCLVDRLRELTPRLTQRALFIVLSDLMDPGAVAMLKQVAEQHDCAIVQLEDPAEQGLRGAGLLRVSEAETGREYVSHGRRSHVDRAALEREFRRAGIDHLRINVRELQLHVVRHFFATRGLIGRGAR